MGDPKGYDITISREGSGLDTEYTVMANPHTAVDLEAVASFEASSINLEALFDGADPFATERPASLGGPGAKNASTGEVSADEEFAGLTDEQEAVILADEDDAPAEPVSPVGRKPKGIK